MTILLPTARILVQRTGTVTEAGEAPFFVLPIADQAENKLGVVSSCTVQMSTTHEGSAAVATFEAANLHPRKVREIMANGYVRIEAGYVGHPTRPPAIIFFGQLTKSKYRLESGQLKWTFSATAFPLDLWAIKPTTTGKTNDDAPLKVTVGEAIRLLADRVGIGRANVSLPAVFDGDLTGFDIQSSAGAPAVNTADFVNAVTLENWSPKGTLFDEIVHLIEYVQTAIANSFHIGRRFRLIPQLNPDSNPYIIDIIDMDSSIGRFVSINLDSSLVMSAGPEETTTQMPPSQESIDAAQEQGVEAQYTNVNVEEYQVTTVFDPLVSMGVLIQAESKKLGIGAKFIVHKGSHTLNGSPLRWRTEYSGQVLETIQVPNE